MLPSGFDADGFGSIEDKSNASWPYGGFLSGVYSTAEHAIQVGSNPNVPMAARLRWAFLMPWKPAMR